MPSHKRHPSDPFHDIPSNDDMLEAVRESVTVKTSSPPTQKVSRHSPGNVSPPRPRRAHSDAPSPTQPNDKPKSSRPKASKKASMHADIIDRLDFSGVGAAMLHHDGPFDACAPSRNKNKTKAPLMAWTAIDDTRGVIDEPYDSSQGGYAAVFSQGTGGSTSIPKKRVDALAEAWGIAEPEPFEEFAAGGGSAMHKNGDHDPWAKRPQNPIDSSRGPARTTNRIRSTLPPPQPIDLPGSRAQESGSPTLPDAPFNVRDASPRRNKSIMARIRKMRDAPNVPVINDDESESESADLPASTATTTTTDRPTHRHQNSFLGRFRSPGAQRSPDAADAEFMFDDLVKDKELPPAPAADYFPPVAERGVSRKTSLMNKIKGGVRGRRNSKE